MIHITRYPYAWPKEQKSPTAKVQIVAASGIMFLVNEIKSQFRHHLKVCLNRHVAMYHNS